MTTLIYSHKAASAHKTPEGHAEQVARHQAALRGVAAHALDVQEAPLCSDADLLRAHPQSYVTQLTEQQPDADLVQLDEDTFMSAASLEAAWRAVGGVCAGIDAVMAGKARNAFVAMRPPGHHAEQTTAMGFCLFSTAAIGVKRLIEHHGLERVALVDFDVHHGNGSQDVLWNEPKALFISSHQMPLYPGTGQASETGASENILNIPLKSDSDGALMRHLYERDVFPKLHAFQPEFIILSAGFDAHSADPLAQLEWDVSDYAWLTKKLCEIAKVHSQGRLVSTLEGGYDLEALEACVAAHVGELKEHGR